MITPEQIRTSVKFGQSLRAETLLEIADRLEAAERPAALTAQPTMCDYRKLQQSGKPYPRTCPECKLGPCKHQSTARPSSVMVPVDDGLPMIIAGALYDFGGFLTTRDSVMEIGATKNASPMVDALKEFAALRGLSLDDAAVLSWQDAMLAAAKEQP